MVEKNEEKKTRKKTKKKKKKQEKTKRRKKKKRGPNGVPTETAQQLIFYIRTVKKNRNEIEAQKNQILSTRQKKRKK